MDSDLQDLLSAWLGNELPADRQEQLLARLRSDVAFQQSYVSEIRLLGMLKAVQSTEPRWLMLEDELGWDDPPLELEERVFDDIQKEPSLKKPTRHWRWIAPLILGVAFLAACLIFWLQPSQDKNTAQNSKQTSDYVAVVVKLDSADATSEDGSPLVEGGLVPSGRLRMQSGHAVLTFFSGMMLSIQGPIDLDLTSVEKIYCYQGKLRGRAIRGAEGFKVLAPGSALVDLGTEFGMNVADDGQVNMAVFEGKIEVSVLNPEGQTLRSERLEGRKAIKVTGSMGQIQSTDARSELFAPPPELVAPALHVGPAYTKALRAAKPWGYWRFETMTNNYLPNDVPGKPGLQATGLLSICQNSLENNCIQFKQSAHEQYLLMDDSWRPTRKLGYSVELWVLPEQLSLGTLVSLSSRAEEPAQKHMMILELAGRGHHLVHDPGVVRFLERWPANYAGGTNVFSNKIYVPYRWHHLVARRTPTQLELYLDGELTGTAALAADAEFTIGRLLVGRLKTGPQPNLLQERPFVGRIDELAVYDYALPPEDIRKHFMLGTTGHAGPP